jgi:chorismate--pyruvate lyase
LREERSLTRQLQLTCGAGFRVHVLRQYRSRPQPSERRLLDMPPSQLALIREVELWCRDRPWVYARTVIPARSLRGKMRRLASLGERPLGAVLFADRHTTKGLVQGVRLSPGQALFGSAVADLLSLPSELWGRRTIFFYGGKPLLVNEVFLPALFEEAVAAAL